MESTARRTGSDSQSIAVSRGVENAVWTATVTRGRCVGKISAQGLSLMVKDVMSTPTAGQGIAVV